MLIAFAALMLVACKRPAMERLWVVNGTEYIVVGKDKNNNYTYGYRLVIGNSSYDYYYEDTASYAVGDTIVLTINKKKYE